MSRTPPINRRIFSTPFAGRTVYTPTQTIVTGDLELDRARELRRAATPAEKVLWALLRQMKTQGHHFRRQAPIGPYFADFACRTSKLVVELDGAQHSEAGQVRYDEIRTAYLETRGYRVLRFANQEVLKNRNCVVDAIHRALPPTRNAARFDLPARGR